MSKKVKETSKVGTVNLGFVPEYTFEEGIKETIGWLKSQTTGDTE